MLRARFLFWLVEVLARLGLIGDKGEFHRNKQYNNK